MKRIASVVLAVFALGVMAAGGTVFPSDDLQAVRKAVKENPSYEEGAEVRWFKVLVQDTRTNKNLIKVTLPIALIEIFIKASDNRPMRIHEEGVHVDLKALFAEMKKVGPMALIEICEENNIIKVWME